MDLTRVMFSPSKMSAKTAGLGEDAYKARWDDSLENISWASFPQLPYISTATGMQVHHNYRHLRPLESSLRASAAKAAAPTIWLDFPKMAGVRGDVTAISSATGLPLSHPAMRIRVTRVSMAMITAPPFSTPTLGWARWLRSATTSLWRLCCMTLSPQCLQVTAWWPRESRALSGQKGHMTTPS